jgi:hypothetical protein
MKLLKFVTEETKTSKGMKNPEIHAQTIGKLNEMKSYFMARNRLLFMRRNSTRTSLFLFWIYFLLVATPKKLVSYFLAKQWKNAMAHVAGVHWNIIHSRNSQNLGYKFNTLTSL